MMEMDDEDMGEETLAKRIAEIHPTVTFSAKVDSMGPMGGDADYLKERHARLKKEIAVAEEQLGAWDPEKVADQARKSLEADLASKRAALMECEAQAEMNGMDYGDEGDAKPAKGDAKSAGKGKAKPSEYVVTGNPYAITKNNDVVKKDTGALVAHHATRAKAMAQFRLLEGVEHGWRPTGKARHQR